jgi:hypothetical protein
MSTEELKHQIFVGVVEDNNDPKRLGRCRVRVLNVFDDIDVDEIPWATPWKDLSGNKFDLPEIGKVLGIVFDEGNPYKPEFIRADHYNINLENKLKKLSEEDYLSMGTLMFNHKTQIYVNDKEGLKIDHKFNNMNIKEDSINLNLKDNLSDLNLGDETASQQAILGNHWMTWFDEFVDNLLGTNGGPYLGNLGAPVVANPAFITVLLKYKALRDPVFLSHHVNIVDNNKVSTVRNTDRENKGQKGDTWKSTVTPNEFTKTEPPAPAPVEGPKPEYDPNYVPPAIDGTPDTVIPPNTNPPATPLSSAKAVPKIDKLIRFMKRKGYKVYENKYILNMVGIRRKDDGRPTNKFDETMCVFFKNANGNWELYEYTITTLPGFEPRKSKLPSLVSILKLGQYVNQFKLGFHQGKTDHKCLKFAKTVNHMNRNPDQYDYNSTTNTAAIGINIHRSNKSGSGLTVFNWSKGCQVFKIANQFGQFISFCERQVSEGQKSSFTYTLIKQSEFDAFV